MSDEFYRIKRLPPYVIAEVNAMRHAARRAGRRSVIRGDGAKSRQGRRRCHQVAVTKYSRNFSRTVIRTA